MFLAGLIIGLFIGVVIGVFVASLCTASSRADAYSKYELDKDIKEIFSNKS